MEVLAILACIIGVGFCIYLLGEAVVMAYQHCKSRSLVVRTKGRPIRHEKVWR